MKRKISIQLSEQVAERLEAAAERPGASKSAIVEAALDRFLSADHEAGDEDVLLRRLSWMSGQLEQLERDLRIVNETVALHARYHLTVTPPITASDQGAACALGLERFEDFAAQVGRRVHLGTPLMRATIDRLSATSPDLFSRDAEEGAPLGPPFTVADQHASAPTVGNGELELSAGVREDASSGGFPGEAHNPYR